jgi:hypothetical protein
MFLHRNETAVFTDEMPVLATVQPPVIAYTLETELSVMRVKDFGDTA